jgi:hypothetical protein
MCRFQKALLHNAKYRGLLLARPGISLGDKGGNPGELTREILEHRRVAPMLEIGEQTAGRLWQNLASSEQRIIKPTEVLSNLWKQSCQLLPLQNESSRTLHDVCHGLAVPQVLCPPAQLTDRGIRLPVQMLYPFRPTV